MSFTELRSFTETMRALGYPRVISLDNFRDPNFELVADCLQWLIGRFSPESTISDDISTEAQRVAFLQAVAGVTLTKAATRLNLKRLYAADGSAVRELLKLASLLHKATHTAASCEEDPGEVMDPSVALKLLDASAAASAAREVVRAGPPLHDGLRAEPQLKEARLRALAAAQDSSMVEAAIQEALAGLSQGLTSMGQQLADAGASEGQLNTRLDKWAGELERAEKRLATLAGVVPAYMEEYNALTAQLQVLWLHYLERFRNLQYLEARLEGYSRAEQEAADAAERRRKKLQRRLAEEELRILRGEQDVPVSAGSAQRPGSSRAGGAGAGTAGGDTTSSSGSDSGSDAQDGAGRDMRATGRSRRGGAAAGGGTWGSTNQQQQQQQQQQQHHQPGTGEPQVVGSLMAGWDEDDSINDDDGSSAAAGVLSHGGSADGDDGFDGARPAAGSAGRPRARSGGSGGGGAGAASGGTFGGVGDDGGSFSDQEGSGGLTASEDSGF